MKIFRAESSGLLEYVINLVVRFAFLAVFVALTVRLWPTGMAEVKFASISNREWAFAATSTFTVIATAAFLFSIWVELVSFSRRERNAG